MSILATSAAPTPMMATTPMMAAMRPQLTPDGGVGSVGDAGAAAVGLLGVALVLLAAEVSGRLSPLISGGALGLAHLVAGGAAYVFAVPCHDQTKKTDDAPSFV